MKDIRHGWKATTTRGLRGGIDLFIEEGAYTSLAAAVSILVVLSLLFAIASGIWSMSRSGDVQVAADTTALAGANVVSSYHTVATVLDAATLSMGLAGLCITGVGLVALLIPGVNSVAPQTIEAGIRLLDTRNDFAASASRGLETLEKSLPVLVAVNGMRVCEAQGSERISYTGVALAVPAASASEFPAADAEQIPTDKLQQTAEELDEAADELEQASEETARAKEAAWLADCGREGRNMQERAGHLAGLSGAQNPDFASSLTWEPNVALDRTRAYYAARLDQEAPEDTSVEARADSAARRAFYQYAIDQFADAEVVEADGRVEANVPSLPRNTAEVRQTELYTQAMWPSTYEEAGLTLHYGAGCPGATGSSGPVIALSAIDTGAAAECTVCRFSVGDVGKTPAASTSIDNGFEYHLKAFTKALEEYVVCRNHELEAEHRAQGAAEDSSDAFDEALSALSTVRPKIAPPGRYGVVALTVAGEADAPDSLETDFAETPRVVARGAISAAALAPEPASTDANVLASFFSSLEERTGGGGVIGLVGDVMDLWGTLLVSYGDMSEELSSLMDELLGGLSSFGLGPVAQWLGDRIDGVVRSLGFEPVDLSSLKPVLTDSAHVLAHADIPALADTQELLRSIPLGTTDPVAVLQALEYEVGEYLSGATFTIAEIALPGGSVIPLTVRLEDVVGLVGGGSP